MNARLFLRRPAALLFSLALAAAPYAVSQQSKLATIHGHAQSPVAAPIAGATVFATTAGNDLGTPTAQADTDANGDYKITGLPPGTYSFVLQDKTQKGTKKVADQTELMPIADSSDTTVDFDLSRPAYLAKLDPAEREKIEAAKAKNASINKENAKIANLNATLKQERDARAAKNYDQAFTLATQITQGKPEEAVGWLELGMDQVGMKKYDDAIPNLKKAIDINSTAKKQSPDIARVANTYLGEADIQSGKAADAPAVYDAAAQVDPTRAAGIYADGATLAYNKNNTDLTATLADKAIAADPKAPMAYYLKGQALIQKATTDKAGKVITPPGCVESYQKYLELDPNGAHAAEVQAILQGIGAKINSSYKAGKK